MSHSQEEFVSWSGNVPFDYMRSGSVYPAAEGEVEWFRIRGDLAMEAKEVWPEPHQRFLPGSPPDFRSPLEGVTVEQYVRLARADTQPFEWSDQATWPKASFITALEKVLAWDRERLEAEWAMYLLAEGERKPQCFMGVDVALGPDGTTIYQAICQAVRNAFQP